MNRREFAIVLMLMIGALMLFLSPQTGGNVETIRLMGSSITFNPTRAILFAGIYVSTVAFFTYHLGKRGEYPDVLYLLAVTTLIVGSANRPPVIPEVIINSTTSLLSKLEVPLTITAEAAFYAYLYLLLLLVTSCFYIAPRHSRELGFLIFGMTFSMPLFRGFISPGGEIIGIASFAVTLALSSSFFFSRNPWIVGIESVLMAVSTVVAFAVRPIAIFIPVSLILTFPRKRRNILYAFFSLLGFVIVWKDSCWLPHPQIGFDSGILLQLSLPLLLVLYLVLSRVRAVRMIVRNTRGPTPFLIVLTIVYAVALLFDRTLFPYVLLLLSSLSVRLIYQLRNIEKRRTGSRLAA
jgi:hypothetical protein